MSIHFRESSADNSLAMNNETLVKFLKSLLSGELLAIIASWASIISLLLTIYVALSIRKIRNTYIFRIRAPQFVRTLRKQASTLIDYANDFESFKQETGDELARVDVKLRAMQGRLRGDLRKAVKELRARIKDYEKEPDDEAKFRLTYRSMQRVIEEVKEYQEDLDLE